MWIPDSNLIVSWGTGSREVPQFNNWSGMLTPPDPLNSVLTTRLKHQCVFFIFFSNQGV